jgi:PAS domain S-box-containing protein
VEAFVAIRDDLSKPQWAAERFRLVIEAAPNAIVIADAAGAIVLVNAEAERAFGHPREELLGRAVETLVPARFRGPHPGHRAAYVAHPLTRPMGAGRDLFGLRKDGSEFPVEIGLTPLYTDEGLLTLAVVVDITERKRAEAARAHLAAMVESSNDAIISKDLEGTILTWNAGAERIYGYPAAEVLGRPVTMLAPADRRDEIPAILARVKDGERIGTFDTVRVRKDGRRIDVALTVSPIRAAAGQIVGASAVARDVTEPKRAAEELRAMTQQLWQAAKLASVGELAASIAHELNNPLATISLRIEAVLARTPADDPRRRGLEVIAQETQRMGDLVANLLQFARRGHDQISTVDVRQELGAAVDLIHHHLRKRQVAVVREFAADTPDIFADRQKLRQLFLNLLTNAGDAMPQGGTLTLRTAADTLADGKPAVRIEVADTGVGIPAEHLDRVLEPFFTTKEEGKGTGLGLAICRRVVQDHHGALQITSEVGRGTTVRLLLPVRNGFNVAPLRPGARDGGGHG